jgi:hypothetical protein
MSTLVKIGIGLLIAGAIVFIAIKVFGFQGKMKTNIKENKAAKQAGKLKNIKNASLDKMEAARIANALYAAMDGAGTDEDAIYSSFKQLINEDDFNLVYSLFGSRDGQDLQQWLTTELSDGERGTINEILKEKRINITI